MGPREEDVAALLAEANLPTPYEISSLSGGGNNRVYRIDCVGGPVLLKAYFQHPDDLRDRLGAEFSFCAFAWKSGLRCVPQPLASSPPLALGLYEFIAGRSVSTAEITWQFVQQAMEFFSQLNRNKHSLAAGQLRNGSEACFTLAEHLHCVERRMGRFEQIDRSTPIGEEAWALVQQQLIPAWNKVHSKVLVGASHLNLELSDPIRESDRCLSPSDFGFHNSIARDDRLTFIDFEYAGWDDPAKTACDFFCQPDAVVPLEYFDRVCEDIISSLSDPAMHRTRIDLLLPVYRVKWCCIMLNEFLPVGSRRRSFARDEKSEQERRAAQLRKVRLALQVIGNG